MKTALRLIFLLLLAAAAGAHAQTYPAKPIRMIIPFAAGGPSDVVGRELAKGLARVLAQQVVVENRSGANGLLGAEAVAKAAPDGYTIMFHNLTSHVSNPWIYKKVPYDTVADFAPITQVSSSALLIAANPAFPAANMSELIAYAKANPKTVGIASFGAGSMAHLGIELLKSMAQIDVNHIPYKGGAPAVTDTLGGHTPVCIVGLPAALQQVKQGRLRALAVTTLNRSKDLPEVPTVAETPGLGGYDASLKYGLWAPAKTPRDILQKLHEAALAVVNAPDFRQRVLQQGMDEVFTNTPEEMAATIRTDMEKIGKLVKAAGLEPE
jgi:tripartite-type tricarboxylate transporter receptor subunit TctC